MIPKHPRRDMPLAPDQIFSAGYRDGMSHKAPNRQFQNHVTYLKGYAEGYQSSTSETASLMVFWRSRCLVTALHGIEQWEKDRARFGFGAVALSYRSGYWAVLVSQDLHDAALPF